MERTNLVRRFLREYASYMKHPKTPAFNDFIDTVVHKVSRGFITNDEAIRLIANRRFDEQEVTHEED